MLIEIKIIAIAKDYIRKLSQKWEIELTIAEERSIQKENGIIFYFNSKKFIEDKNRKNQANRIIPILSRK
ncbi:hypothetical protein FY557_11015 [Chryseobacterium sp. SN22]|uniref:hypothetical protein n=1 Tax=Chryseobacterium sp. SN22 TaxID=2606431 RepID=UPI0011EC0A4D|nr:hypothetical protein [Chryseobacterium sp. SN22]KAA0127929.1 hypothetical protein FY557_11015 [Chryseobacterium sp. SN22]